MKKEITRREALSAVGIAGGASWLTSYVDEKVTKGAPANKLVTAAPAYVRLDPVATAEKAYQYCRKGHCMYGAFTGIVAQLGEKLGEPYKYFPCEMMIYGRSGVCNWGSLCGALNGSAAVVGLICRSEKQQTKIIDELFRWYEETVLPVYTPTEPVTRMDMPKSISRSVLCHNSITNWSKTSGFKVFTERQKERCLRLTADVAKKTVEILNAEFSGEFQPAHTLSPNVASCRSCHSKPSEMRNTRGKMDCGNCHKDVNENHHEKGNVSVP